MSDGFFLTRERRAEFPDFCVLAWARVGRWFVEQDKGSAVPHHGFGIFFGESLRFFAVKPAIERAGYGMAEINFQPLSRRPFLSCNWVIWDTEFRTSLITGDATIERPEDTRDILMQAALRGRSRSQQLQHCHSLLQATSVAVTQITRNRNDAGLRHQHESDSGCLGDIEPAELGSEKRTIRTGSLAQRMGMVELGDVEKGVAELEAGAAATLGFSKCPSRRCSRACIFESIGFARQSRSWMSEGFERWGARLYLTELYRLKGEATLALGTEAGRAEHCFREALTIARSQSAKLPELRVTASLARLLRYESPRRGAQMLAEIYNCFTAGFDTADLAPRRCWTNWRCAQRNSSWIRR